MNTTPTSAFRLFRGSFSIIRGIAAVGLMAMMSLHAAEPKKAAGVPEDAVYFNGKWYKAFLDGSGWKSSQGKCQRVGGQLAIVPNQETQTFLKKLANGRKLIIGASKERSEVWKWVDGSAMTFQAWDRGQPNDVKGNENYLALGPKGSWYDVADSTDWTQGYICEWKAR
ncbi:MAG: lectin-like protein [Roseimicrobium sp.]